MSKQSPVMRCIPSSMSSLPSSVISSWVEYVENEDFLRQIVHCHILRDIFRRHLEKQETVYVLYVLSLPLGIGISIALIFSSIYIMPKAFPLSQRSCLGSYCDGFHADCLDKTWTIIKPRSHLVTELFLQVRKPIKCMLWLLPEAFSKLSSLGFILSSLGLDFG
uniref:Uncharacterized protein n=1 Tax=Ditylenchus dipsaci TaxID=166011 RepID=A0A915EPF1_9BILA